MPSTNRHGWSDVVVVLLAMYASRADVFGVRHDGDEGVAAGKPQAALKGGERAVLDVSLRISAFSFCCFRFFSGCFFLPIFFSILFVFLFFPDFVALFPFFLPFFVFASFLFFFFLPFFDVYLCFSLFVFVFSFSLCFLRLFSVCLFLPVFFSFLCSFHPFFPSFASFVSFDSSPVELLFRKIVPILQSV